VFPAAGVVNVNFCILYLTILYASFIESMAVGLATIIAVRYFSCHTRFLGLLYMYFFVDVGM
jgi:hypothetical protein